MEQVLHVRQIYKDPPSLDGVKLEFSDGTKVVLSGTEWAMERRSPDYPPNKEWIDKNGIPLLQVIVNQGRDNKETMVEFSEDQVAQITGLLGYPPGLKEEGASE